MKFFACVMRVILFALVVVAAFPTTARAAASRRTWVSAVGDDVNPCTRSAPCRTFAGALAQTLAGGEIDVIDNGGYGAVVITKAVTIDGTGTLAGIANPGTNGVTVNAPGAVVTLRGININGDGTGATGVAITAASRVNVEDCVIAGQATGIDANLTAAGTTVSVRNSTIRNNTGDGFAIGTTTGFTSAYVSASSFDANAGAGVRVKDRAYLTMVRSTVFNGGTGVLVAAPSNSAQVVLKTAGIYSNTTGLAAGGAGTTMYLADCDISANTTGISSGGGAVTSAGNNRIAANTSPGTAPLNVGPQ